MGRSTFGGFRKMNVSRPASIKQGPKAKEGLQRFPTTGTHPSLRGKRRGTLRSRGQG
jgi:hypothetical protein